MTSEDESLRRLKDCFYLIGSIFYIIKLNSCIIYMLHRPLMLNRTSIGLVSTLPRGDHVEHDVLPQFPGAADFQGALWGKCLSARFSGLKGNKPKRPPALSAQENSALTEVSLLFASVGQVRPSRLDLQHLSATFGGGGHRKTIHISVDSG